MAKPTLEADSHAKVKMRRKVRGLRAIERQVLAQPGRTRAPSAAAAAGGGNGRTNAPSCGADPAEHGGSGGRRGAGLLRGRPRHPQR